MWLASSGMVGRHLWQRGLAFCARQGRTCLQNSLLGPLVPSTANWLCEGILLCPQIYLLKTTGAKQPLPGLNGLTDLRQPANKQNMKKKSPILLFCYRHLSWPSWLCGRKAVVLTKPTAFTSALNEAPHLETAYLRFWMAQLCFTLVGAGFFCSGLLPWENGIAEPQGQTVWRQGLRSLRMPVVVPLLPAWPWAPNEISGVPQWGSLYQG